MYAHCFIFSLLYFILGSSLRFNTALAENKNCDKNGTLLYEDIGCELEITKYSCPDLYRCDDMLDLNPTLCFRGPEVYKEGDDIDLPGSCMDCKCKKGEKEGLIECKNVSCPKNPPPKEGCQYKRKSFKCCDFGEFCPKDNSKVKCEYNGKTYKAGDYFKAKDSCHECICSKGFKGKIEEPFCRREVCLEDVYRRQEVRDYCGPLFFEPDNSKPRCCPDAYICEKDIVFQAFSVIGKGDDIDIFNRCNFNGFYFKRDTTLQVKSKKSKKFAFCTCQTPPYMTCTVTS